MWSYGNYMNINIGNLLKYFATLSVSFHDINSLFGFFTFLTIWGTLTYPGSVDEALDKSKGLVTEYPIFKWLVAAVISWAFIFAF